MAKPALLLYDPIGSAWVPKLKQYCAVQGLRLRPVEASGLGRTVGALAQGLAAPAGENAPEGFVESSPAVSEPLLIFCSLSNAQLDRLLAALRRMEVPRTVLKAVLTPDNAGWSLSALYRELCRERQAMEG